MRHKENMISVKQHSSGKSKSYEPMKKKKKKQCEINKKLVMCMRVTKGHLETRTGLWCIIQ